MEQHQYIQRHQPRQLWITEVGSRMWGMDDVSSDHDLVEVYQCSTTDILRGERCSDTRPMKKYISDVDGIEVDHQAMEVGHLINLLIKGNINTIWAVTSPKVWYADNPSALTELASIVRANLSKASVKSIQGMAISQMKDASLRAHVRNPAKSRITALRTIKFGEELLASGKLNYNVKDKINIAAEEITNGDLLDAIHYLDVVYNQSPLPASVDPEPFRDYLYRLRVQPV
jgi:predicted nucleotidyltransferase